MKSISNNLILALALLKLARTNNLENSEIEATLELSLENLNEIEGGYDGFGARQIQQLCNKCNTPVSELYAHVELLKSELISDSWLLSDENIKNLDFITLFELFEFINQPQYSDISK